MVRVAWLWLAAQALCSPGAVAAQSPACAAQHFDRIYPKLAGTTLRIGQDGQSAPYSFRDARDYNTLEGIDADFARAVFTCLGINTEFVTGAWSGLLPALIAGQTDVMWNALYYTPERARQVDYVTYMVAATGSLVQKGNPKHIKQIEDLCGLRATGGLGTVEYARLKDASAACIARGRPGIELVTYTDMSGGERLLQNDRTDLMLSDLSFSTQVVREHPGQFEIAFSIRSDMRIGVGVRKGRADLEAALQQAIQLLQADGTQRSVLLKYGLEPTLQQSPEVLRE